MSIEHRAQSVAETERLLGLGPPLRANGSREGAPDNRLHEAIHGSIREKLDCFVALLLAMTAMTDCFLSAQRTK
jgi:hypothetical protein